MSDIQQDHNLGPLNGVRVLDLTTVQMGPLATAILADLGADVIKIEAPEGDVSRQSFPARSPRMGHSFLAINRNKRSIALDLKQPEGKSALLALAKSADVLVFNVRPQAMARLKLSYEDVKAVNPQIVYVGALGFSQRGRYGGRPAFDTVIQGMAGLPWMAAHASGHEPRYAPHSFADQSSALHVVIAVLAGLYHRKATGMGQEVNVPMFESLVHVLLGEHLAGEMFVPPLGTAGYARQLSRDRRPYRTKDGYICPFLYSDKHWRIFFKMIGKTEQFESDPRFSSHGNRTKNMDVVYAFLSDTLQARTTAEWMRLFDEYDLPIGRMNSLEDVLRDPHLADIHYFGTVEHPTEGTLRATCYPTEFSKTPVSNRRPAPRLGEDTVELLREAGYSQSRIDEMVAKGVAISPSNVRTKSAMS